MCSNVVGVGQAKPIWVKRFNFIPASPPLRPSFDDGDFGFSAAAEGVDEAVNFRFPGAGIRLRVDLFGSYSDRFNQVNGYATVFGRQ